MRRRRNCNRLPAAIDLSVPRITPALSGRQVYLLLALPLFPNGGDENVATIKISPPVSPRRSRIRINQKERTNDRHSSLCRLLQVRVTVVAQSLMQSRIHSPHGNKLRVVLRTAA